MRKKIQEKIQMKMSHIPKTDEISEQFELHDLRIDLNGKMIDDMRNELFILKLDFTTKLNEIQNSMKEEMDKKIILLKNEILNFQKKNFINHLTINKGNEFSELKKFGNNNIRKYSFTSKSSSYLLMKDESESWDKTNNYPPPEETKKLKNDEKKNESLELKKSQESDVLNKIVKVLEEKEFFIKEKSNEKLMKSISCMTREPIVYSPEKNNERKLSNFLEESEKILKEKKLKLKFLRRKKIEAEKEMEDLNMMFIKGKREGDILKKNFKKLKIKKKSLQMKVPPNSCQKSLTSQIKPMNREISFIKFNLNCFKKRSDSEMLIAYSSPETYLILKEGIGGKIFTKEKKNFQFEFSIKNSKKNFKNLFLRYFQRCNFFEKSILDTCLESWNIYKKA